MQKTLRQLMDDIAHIDAGHVKQRTLEGYNRHKRDLHHTESWISEAPAIGVKPPPVAAPAPAKPAPVLAQGAKKWPQTDPEIRAFQRANPPLVVDGLIGKKTLARLTQLGYTLPAGFKPVADKAVPGVAPATSTLAPTAVSNVAQPSAPRNDTAEIELDADAGNFEKYRDQFTPKSGDFSGAGLMGKDGRRGGTNRMPPGEKPPGAVPYKNNPELQYEYKGQVYDLETGYALDDDSPMRRPGQKERQDAYNTDAYGNKRGSYSLIDVLPVQAELGLPQGRQPNDMDRIQQAFGRGMKLGASYDFKTSAISIWYRPEGGKDRMYHDYSMLPSIMGDWTSSFKQLGYQFSNMKDQRMTNSIGNALGEDFQLINAQGQKLHGAGMAQQMSFKTPDGKNGLSTIDVSFLGPEQEWQNGGQEAWKNAVQSLKLASTVQAVRKVKSARQEANDSITPYQFMADRD